MSDIVTEGLSDSFVITKRFRSPKEFAGFIEQSVVHNEIGYMDAVIKYCQEVQIDIESIGPLINKQLKEKIHHEALKANMLKEPASQ